MPTLSRSLRVSADEKTTHPVLLGAPGVKKAAQAVEAAGAAASDEREKRRRAHAKWYGGLRTGETDKASLPPERDLTPAETEVFRRDLDAARWRLQAAVDAAGDDIIEAARIREEEILEETRRLVARLEERAGELARLGRAVDAVATARNQRGPKKAPSVRAADLLYLATKSNPAVIDFGDGRTLWLNVRGRA